MKFCVWCLEVGLCKQTLFSGLPCQPLPVPNIFTMDIMHLMVLNDPDVKKQSTQDVLHGDAAEEELGLACLVSSYTLPHQSSQPGKRGQQTARSKVLSRRARDT